MSEAPAPPTRTPLVVLVHGAWHGAWCWAAVQAVLDERGIPSLAVDLPGHGASTLPLGDLHGDAQHVADVIDAADREVVLVGHSYGGAVVTEAASRTAHVRHLVYVTAFALAPGESVMALLGSLPRAEVLLSKATVRRPDGTTVLDPAAAAPALYGACGAGAVRAALERLGPQPASTFTQAVSGDPRGTTASTYVCCSDDQAISIVHQREMAARCDHVVTLASDHSPFLSMPAAIADVVETATRTVRP